MAILTQAPLIEAIFELRWGQISRDPTSGGMRFSFSSEDTDFFPGQFHGLVSAEGFATAERVNPDIPMPGLPHTVSYRFRRAPDTWPCYQIGTGIFSANQVNDGYAWKTFKSDILSGLTLLDKGHPSGLSNLPGIGVELRYQDGFLFEQDESPRDFLQAKMEMGFAVPDAFIASANLDEQLQGNKIAFHLGVKKPTGILLISLDQASINGKPGFVMNTSLRSADGAQPELSLKELEQWLDDAHKIQQHAFSTLISKKYAGSFQ